MTMDVMIHDAGNNDNFDDIIEHLVQIIGPSGKINDMPEVAAAVVLVRVYEMTGQLDRADALKAEVQEFLPHEVEVRPRMAPTVANLTAQTRLWRGDIDRALSDLESVPGAYMRHAWYLSRDPGLESLHGHPRFEAVVDAIQKRIDSDRAELEKSGDNLPPCITNQRPKLN